MIPSNKNIRQRERRGGNPPSGMKPPGRMPMVGTPPHPRPAGRMPGPRSRRR